MTVKVFVSVECDCGWRGDFQETRREYSSEGYRKCPQCGESIKKFWFFKATKPEEKTDG